ncbi:hypothetical protein HYDPIDRAFT_51570, partial [Hydnomerulius pinastri MD-312]
SEAICNAINQYNTQAASLSPPRPPISWQDITEYMFLGEFDLLCHSRTDVRDEDWAKPAHQEATTKYFKLQQAREELVHVSVEVRRLYTAIHDEENEISRVVSQLLPTDPFLASELQKQHHSWHAVNVV